MVLILDNCSRVGMLDDGLDMEPGLGLKVQIHRL